MEQLMMMNVPGHSLICLAELKEKINKLHIDVPQHYGDCMTDNVIDQGLTNTLREHYYLEVGDLPSIGREFYEEVISTLQPIARYVVGSISSLGAFQDIEVLLIGDQICIKLFFNQG